MCTEHLWDGARLCVANARDLFDTASESASMGRFGVATSLAVLSAEECAKSYALLARAVSGNTEATQLKAYFTSHKAKHEMGSAVLTLFRIVNRLQSIALEVASDESIANDEKGGHLISRISEWSDAEVDGRENIAEDIAAWRKNADRAKQNGFYVDQVVGGWHSPAHICESEYIFRRDYALQWLMILESIFEYGSLAEFRRAIDDARVDANCSGCEP